MTTESEIFDCDTPNIVVDEGYCDLKLLKTTSNAKLYRATRQGKYFLLKTTKDNSEYQQKLLYREYELSIGCDHPHIVHTFIYDTKLPVGPAIVMEYLECRTLAEYLAERPSGDERKRIFEELISAVEYLHKRGVIHNDLKPENILVTYSDNRLKLADFGLADSDAEAMLKMLGCTPRYASPELRARGVVDARSDIYSIGVIMGELLGESAIVRRCTAENPECRFANVEALRHAWRSRHRGWRILRNIFFILVVIAPMALYLYSWSVARQSDNARDRMLTGMEREIADICNALTDSVYNAPYMEFASRHLRSMWEQCDAVQRKYLAMTDDTYLQSLLYAHYEELYKRYFESLAEHLSTYPCFYIEVKGEERKYLDSLIVNELPYVPYKGNAKDK